MTSEPNDRELLDLILAPLENVAVGEDLRLDLMPRALYSAMRDARSEARAAERLADNDPASGPANPAGWRTVERLAVEALGSRTKDIEIGCWLVESLTRRCGLLGLTEGVDILAGLIDRFWNEGLFPAFDPEDPDGRFVAIGGLSGQERDGTLLQPLRAIVLFERQDGEPVTLWQYERSREVATLGDKAKTQRASTVVADFADLEMAAHGAGRASLIATGREAGLALDAWERLASAMRLASTMQGMQGSDSLPATGRVRDLLAGIRKIVERHVPAEELEPAPDDVSAATEIEAARAEAPAARLQPSREAMLDEALRIAAAFRTSEPNSPFSYTLEEAVRRARLSWPELLREVMPDLSPRASVLSGLGIRAPIE